MFRIRFLRQQPESELKLENSRTFFCIRIQGTTRANRVRKNATEYIYLYIHSSNHREILQSYRTTPDRLCRRTRIIRHPIDPNNVTMTPIIPNVIEVC